MLALGHGLTADELTARVSHLVPVGPSARARNTEWGAWFVSGNHLERAGWVVAGHPTQSCWGVPGGTPIELDAVVRDLVRFGPLAATTFAGPLVAVDVGSSRWTSSLSGLAALGRPMDDHQLEMTTAEVRRATDHVAVVPDCSPGFRAERLVEEIAHHLGATTPGPILRDPTDQVTTMVAGLDWAESVRAIGSDLVLHPPNLRDVLGDAELIGIVRTCVAPRLAWRAERIGRVLYAPFLERPVLDQLGFATASASLAGANR